MEITTQTSTNAHTHTVCIWLRLRLSLCYNKAFECKITMKILVHVPIGLLEHSHLCRGKESNVGRIGCNWIRFIPPLSFSLFAWSSITKSYTQKCVASDHESEIGQFYFFSFAVSFVSLNYRAYVPRISNDLLCASTKKGRDDNGDRINSSTSLKWISISCHMIYGYTVVNLQPPIFP